MQRRRAISSIYGFIMIFLLSMASVQTWSYAISSETSVENASLHQHQLQQMQSAERLVLTESKGNLTIFNGGQITSTIEFLRFLATNNSKTVSEGVQISPGSVLRELVPLHAVVQVVTSLGNVFQSSPPFAHGSIVLTGPALLGGRSNAELFQNPHDSSVFFMGSGSVVQAVSTSGEVQWSFDAKTGFVTDVLPLVNGDVFVSVAYASTSNIAELFELNPAGGVIQTYQVRATQIPAGAFSSATPATKGADSAYAYYDGWFYSPSGLFAPLQSDGLPLAGTDSSSFYFYKVTPEPYVDGSCQLPGNEVVLSSYQVNPRYSGGFKVNWQDYSYFGICDVYPPQLISSVVEGGTVAALFATLPYANPTGSYPTQNPYLLIASPSGVTLYFNQTPEQGYSSLATNGTLFYLALPQSGQVQVFSLAKSAYTTYDVGFSPTQLIFSQNHLFAISNDMVKVFTPSMSLERTIDLAPSDLASASNSFPQEQPLQAPSFLVLNSTTYAALLVNGTGWLSLSLGHYS